MRAFKLDDAGLLKISGKDAARFLQNQSTNDVASLKPGESQANASVDRQGKLKGVYTLYFDAETYWLLLAKTQLELLVKHLAQFKIMDDVVFEDVSKNHAIYGVLSKTTPENLPDAAVCVPYVPGYAVWLTSDLPGEGFFEALSSEEWHQFRVEAGIPMFGVDYDNETMLPETGLQRDCVSYNKGCYLGQEVIARVKTYGTLQKALCGLLFPDLKNCPAVDSEITIDGKVVGVTKSAVFSKTFNAVISLAYLDKAHRVPGKTLAIQLNGKPVSTLVSTLPFSTDRAAILREEALRLFSVGKESEAVTKLREALAIREDIETCEALGVILGRDENTLDEAMQMMDKVLALDADHVMAHTNLSIYWLKKGNKDKAEEEKAKATVSAFRKKAKEAGLTPPDMEAEKAKKQKALLERVGLFEEALKHAPDDPLGNFGLGSIYLELERFAEAVGPLQKVIAAQPKHTVAYLSLGKALTAVGQEAQAKEILEKGMEVAAARGDMMPLQDMQRLLAKMESKVEL